jgi:hypothetical protein
MISVEQLVRFVLKYRRGKAFFNYTEEEIRREIQVGIKKFACIVDCDENENIFGIATGDPVPSYLVMHVRNILTIKKGSLMNILNRFMEVYPLWDIQGYRHDNLTRYPNINKLKDKIYGRSLSTH